MHQHRVQYQELIVIRRNIRFLLCLLYFIAMGIAFSLPVEKDLLEHYQRQGEYTSKVLTADEVERVLLYFKQELSLDFDLQEEFCKLANHINETLSQTENLVYNHFVSFPIGAMSPRKSYFVFYNLDKDNKDRVVNQLVNFIFKNGFRYVIDVDIKGRSSNLVIHVTLQNAAEGVPFFCRENPFSLVWSSNEAELGLVDTVKIPLDIEGFKTSKNRLFATAYPERPASGMIPLHKNLDFFDINGSFQFGAIFYAIHAYIIDGQKLFWNSYTDEYISECNNPKSNVGAAIQYYLSKNLTPQNLSYSVLTGAVGFSSVHNEKNNIRDVIFPVSLRDELQTENNRLKQILIPLLRQRILKSFEEKSTASRLLNQFLEDELSIFSQNLDSQFIERLQQILNYIQQIESGKYEVLYNKFSSEFEKVDFEKVLNLNEKKKLIQEICSNCHFNDTLIKFKNERLVVVINDRLQLFFQDVAKEVDAITDKDIGTIGEIITFLRENSEGKNDGKTAFDDQSQTMKMFANEFDNIINNEKIKVLYEKKNRDYLLPLMDLCTNININILDVIKQETERIETERNNKLNEVATKSKISLKTLKNLFDKYRGV